MANRHLGLEIDPATGLTGLSGGNPLPQDWDELVYKDLGYTANNRPVLPGWTKPQTPKNVIEINPLSMTSGSNIVTVTMSSPHGFTTGDDVALGNTAIPVPTTAGIPGAALTGGHIITVTGPTTFTFAATSYATHPGYLAVPATATVSGAGGSIRITNRDQWRDAWLEASIATIVAQAKKKRSTYAPDHKKRKEERKARRQAMAAEKKTRLAKKKADLRSASKRYKRDVACPSEGGGGVTLSHVSEMAATKNVTFDMHLESSVDREQEVRRVRAEVADVIISELSSGGMCLTSEGVLMATPTCKSIAKIVEAKNLAAASAFAPDPAPPSKRCKKGDAKCKKDHNQALAKRNDVYNACIKACGTNATPGYRQCILKCSPTI